MCAAAAARPAATQPAVRGLPAAPGAGTALPQPPSHTIARFGLYRGVNDRANAPSALGTLSPGLSSQATQTPLAVSGYGVSALTGLQLPRWQTRGHLYNCSAAYVGPTTAPIPLAACLVACLRDANCDAIGVEWVQKHSWPRPVAMAWYGNVVRCSLRGGMDLSSCDEDGAALPSHSTITMARGHALAEHIDE